MGMVDMMNIYETGTALYDRGYSRVSPHFIPRILVNMPAGHVSQRYGLRVRFLSWLCYSSWIIWTVIVIFVTCMIIYSSTCASQHTDSSVLGERKVLLCDKSYNNCFHLFKAEMLKRRDLLAVNIFKRFIVGYGYNISDFVVRNQLVLCGCSLSTVVACWACWSTVCNRSSTWGMFETQIHVISLGCPWPGIAIQCWIVT